MNFRCHLGVGDALILSGAVVHYAENNNVNFPCWRIYLPSVRSFFVKYPTVTVYPVDSEHEILDGLRSGYYHSSPQPNESMDEWFYRQMGLPLEIRWIKCPIPDAVRCCSQEPVPDGPYAFVHDSDERPLSKLATPLPCVRPIRMDGILRYGDLIENAEEVHVMRSSFEQLANCLKPKGKLVLHRYARHSNNLVLDTAKSPHTWHIVD